MAAATVNTPEEHRAAASQRPYTPPPGATEVIVVRHGASADAVPGKRFPLIEGRGDPPLSVAGEAQAAAVAARLGGEPIDAIYVTPLQRTQRTAAPLAAALRLEPVVIDELIEVSLGDWEGGEYRLRAAAGDPLVRKVFEEDRWDALPNGETADSLARRVRAGIVRIIELTGPDRVAVAVLHGGVIGEVCRQATQSRALAFVHSDNGSISRLVIGADGSWLLRGFNDTSHLVSRSR
ncbi:MAG TPA: histidine phosphatase family protein [Solirubrobacteraceae bacterium]|jgi:probable phosphoglycerate mutase|nr:histidine phosphatase family protein [Solirubrobacteraceae bacterium]